MDSLLNDPLSRLFLVVLAAAAHFHGCKGIAFSIIDNKQKQTTISVTKNKKLLYRGRGSSQVEALQNLFRNLRKKEEKAQAGKHADCYVCKLFGAVYNYEAMRLALAPIVEGAMREIAGVTTKNSQPINPEQLN